MPRCGGYCIIHKGESPAFRSGGKTMRRLSMSRHWRRLKSRRHSTVKCMMNLALRLVLLIALCLPGAALAQDSVITLEPPAAEAVPGEAQPAAPPPPCGTQQLTIARMTWPSAALLAEIHSRLLTRQLSLQRRGTGRRPRRHRLVDGRQWPARGSARALDRPHRRYLERGDQGPESTAGRRLLRRARFRRLVRAGLCRSAVARDHHASTGSRRMRPISATATGAASSSPCPLDWGCAIVNRNMLRAYGLDQMFDIVEPANRFELDTLIAEAVGRQGADPVLLLAAQRDPRPVRLRGGAARPVRCHRLHLPRPAQLRRAGPSRLCPRSGGDRARRMGLSRCPAGRRPISAAPACLSPR